MKEAIIINLDGYMTDVTLVDDNETGVFPLYKLPDSNEEGEAEKPSEPIAPVVVGHRVSIRPPEGLYKPQFNLETETWGEGRAASYILEDIRQSKISILNNACNAAILSGFTSNALEDEHTYDFDYEAQTNLGGMLNAIMAEIVTEKIYWKASGLPVPHTINQFKQVYADGLTHKNSLITKYWTLKSQVLSANSLDDIESVTWSK
ncbi:hypothetical protein [Paenibacillus periandrae]|uniref:DUF4376 domain-containing protein n=1 Tax=Paenibacillus periandrae TaxID=1761741 RepID=UPI001F08AFD7|nr:hypothetical protein [Paenibacillus periandrae]